ncbi:MAG: ROK family protein [Candidatus Omnitrophota bacterium]
MAIKRECTFTYKDISDRKRKNLAILDHIRRKGEVSRTDISKETDINIVSVSNYVMSYLKKGLVLECGLDISTGGRRPELVRLNLESAYVAGVDIGPEKLIAVIANLGLKTQAKIAIPRPKGDMDKVVEGTVGALEKLFKEFGKPRSDIKLIGIGASGVIDLYSGTIRDTDPARGKTKTDLLNMARLIEERFNIPSLVGNDATCAAFGELSLSPDTTINDMLYVYSDIGCGIIINRDIYCGASGSAGEVQLLANGKPTDKKGAIDVASYGIKGTDLGIVDRAKRLVGNESASKILQMAGNNQETITKEIIFKAAQGGDKLARELLIDAAYWLGVKVAYLVNIFNPQMVVIGGGMEKAGSVFMESLSSCIRMYAFEEAFNVVKISPSYLGEDAIALGAASLSVRELFIRA